MARAPLLLVVWLLGGCIAIPHGQMRAPASRDPIDADMVSFVRPGSTTREELLLRLGAPRYRWKGDRVFGYAWTSSGMTMVIVAASAGGGVGGGAGAFEVYTNYFLLVDFDEAGRVVRVRRDRVPLLLTGPSFIRGLAEPSPASRRQP